MRAVPNVRLSVGLQYMLVSARKRITRSRNAESWICDSELDLLTSFVLRSKSSSTLSRSLTAVVLGVRALHAAGRPNR